MIFADTASYYPLPLKAPAAAIVEVPVYCVMTDLALYFLHHVTDPKVGAGIEKREIAREDVYVEGE